MKKARLVLFCLIVLAITGGAGQVARAEAELSPPAYLTVVDEDGRHLMVTGHSLRPGDEFLSAENRRYRILRVENGRAVARLTGQEDLSSLLTPQDEEAIARWREEEVASASPATSLAERIRAAGRPGPTTGRPAPAGGELPLPVQGAQKVVGIYHTHSDES